MSDCQDMTTALARELTQGIEGEVEDLGEVFKRMALLKPPTEVIEGDTVVVADFVDVSETTIITQDVIEPVVDVVTKNTKKTVNPKPPTQPSGLLALINKPKPATRKKRQMVLENQMSLFDLLDESA